MSFFSVFLLPFQILFTLIIFFGCGQKSDKKELFPGQPVTAASSKLSKDVIQTKWCEDEVYVMHDGSRQIHRLTFNEDGTAKVEFLYEDSGQVASVEHGGWSGSLTSIVLGTNKRINRAQVVIDDEVDPAVMKTLFRDNGEVIRRNFYACD
tara:strand:+ start:169837 stop:170289 length:453 start_codon:yes stop_codon:yes gene_type:complete